ncbi:MAG: TlpA family protein disulfide reductase [Flavobacterium sp.]|jgi:thiol-disulfide isomerase/thioredoxin|uniref:TlpA family protein disulfide reductase n=1 Tax=Flavobacterium sp. TaxID=239 RepID=UPI0022C5F191|nr:TlpA disulfide reductase family protein [Flavobacterium sp.]MCZ8167862.1 TlpA disulfide reductase family protein [Flavobacterium sp.]MCZ8297651.1 TlpA disulfide reductase family protein [Flavobacterium sp.]
MKNIFFLLLLSSFLTTAQSTLPEVTLTNLEGKSVVLNRDFVEKDKLYIISFWATWCGPCINELDELNDVIEDWKKELNLEVIAVSTDDARTQKRVKPLVNGKGWPYTILLDTNQDLKRALTIVNIPYTIVVKNGQIVHIQNGYVPGSEAALLAKLKQL